MIPWWISIYGSPELCIVCNVAACTVCATSPLATTSTELILSALKVPVVILSASSLITVAIAADTLSAARPGSRSEKIENYIQRLEKLEELPKQFEGVDKVFAIQAGREIRVIVNPEKIDDLKAHKLARDVKEKIETELTYPGHIKVTVIREIRANEIAK